MKTLIEDNKAKTKSFFLDTKKNPFSQKHLNFLINFYKKNNLDVRICLHRNRKSNHHDMIILQQKKNFYKPHKHLKKGETYHIIKGSMICVIFNNNGNIKNLCHIKKGDIFRTPINKYHTMLPYSKFVIYHESKVGPFLLKRDSIFPHWIKKFINEKEIALFKNMIIKKIDR
jgi:cupin fold WbuC family metalloprotein